jgi:hypothetical protein
MPVGSRLHLFELEDQSWFPRWLRDPMTDFLGVVARLSRRAYAPFVDRLAPALAHTGAARLVDLGSGDGAAALVVTETLTERRGERVPVVLTDLHPNLPALERARASMPDLVSYRASPVDAGAVPPDLRASA